MEHSPHLVATTAEVLRPRLLSGKTAIVTGAGTGIGRAIALRLAALDMTVIGIGRRIELLEETRGLAADLAGRLLVEGCNLRDADAASGLIDRIGREHGIDLLVNNAGGQFYARATEISRKGWDSVIDLNLSSIFTATMAAYPYLRNRRGSIANLSLSGVERGTKGLAHSIAARAGVLGMTRTLALEWARDGVRINCIGPGMVQTTGLERPVARDRAADLIHATPAGRATTPEEVAELIAFLASDAGRLMTGQLIHIDGAAHIGPGLDMID